MNFLDYLKELKEKHSENIRGLKNTGRDDEYKFEKIRENVCDIFITLYSASEKRAKNPDDFKSIYLGYFENIPKPWKIKLEKDKNNNNFEEAFIEEIKLELLDQIKTRFVGE